MDDMTLPIFINKWIIGYKPIMYSPFWWWWKLMSHQGFRFDDYHIWGSFWSSLNGGWLDMNYQSEFERIWGKGAKPEIMYISGEAYDKLQEMIAEPPKLNLEIIGLLNRKAPWDEPND